MKVAVKQLPDGNGVMVNLLPVCPTHAPEEILCTSRAWLVFTDDIEVNAHNLAHAVNQVVLRDFGLFFPKRLTSIMEITVGDVVEGVAQNALF